MGDWITAVPDRRILAIRENLAMPPRKRYGTRYKCSGFDREVDLFRAALKSGYLSLTYLLNTPALYIFRK